MRALLFFCLLFGWAISLFKLSIIYNVLFFQFMTMLYIYALLIINGFFGNIIITHIIFS